MIDIHDLNYDISNEDVKQIEKISRFDKKGLFYGLSRIVYFSGKSLFQSRVNLFCFKRGHVNFVVGSKNQHKALGGVQREFGAHVVVITPNFKLKNAKYYPTFISFLFSIPFLPVLFYLYLHEKSKYRKKSMRVMTDRYLQTFGLTLLNKLLLRISKPSIIVFANDHCVWQRSLIREARLLGIKTAYIQHAHVSNSFPPLEFDFSFLDGEKAFLAYGGKSTGDVYLVGSTRHENVLETVRSVDVALCVNTMDSLEFVRSNLRQLCSLVNNVVLRPHPADSRLDELRRIAHATNANFSNPRNEDINALLGRSKIMLAGESGVHLDALFAGCNPVTVLDWMENDYYGFLADGIVTSLSNISDIERLTQLPSIPQTVKREYNAYVGMKNLPKPSATIKSILVDQACPKYMVTDSMGIHRYNADQK